MKVGPDRDYWAGAVKACKDKGKKLSSHSDLYEIAKALYPNQTIDLYYTGNLTYTAGTATSLGLPELNLWFFSDEEHEEYDMIVYAWQSSLSETRYESTARFNPIAQAICVGE